MRAQLEAHLFDINRTADVAHHALRTEDAIDLVVVTDSEAILGIGGGLVAKPVLRIQTKALAVSQFRPRSLPCTHLERASTRIGSCP